GCSFAPTRSFPRRLNCITNVFSVAQRHFAEQPSIPVAHFHAVAGIRARLLASDVELHRSVNRRQRHIRIVAWFLTGSRFGDRKSTRLNSSHEWISYAVFCLK